MSTVRPNTPRTAMVREVIQVEALRGRGVQGDAARIVTQYWDVGGELLAEKDPFPHDPDQRTLDRMVMAAQQVLAPNHIGTDVHVHVTTGLVRDAVVAALASRDVPPED